MEKELSIGESIKAARIAHGYSIADLSERTTITKNALASWERNQYSPRLDGLIILADTFHMSIDDLIGHKVKKG